MKEVAVKKLELSGEVALDFGMECLFATDRGDLLGREFYSKVKEYAQKIDKLQRNLQRQGIKPTQSKRYQKLNHRLREYVKSEVRRILNRVVELYRPARLVVEDLRYFVKRVINSFPKAVKRVLIRFGLGEIRRKLKELQEEYGIEVIYVNPAYTSQTCSDCGYVDKENRKSRSEFECKLCGRKLHADVNASRNLLSRAKWGMRLHGVQIIVFDPHGEYYEEFEKFPDKVHHEVFENVLFPVNGDEAKELVSEAGFATLVQGNSNEATYIRSQLEKYIRPSLDTALREKTLGHSKLITSYEPRNSHQHCWYLAARNTCKKQTKL